MRNTRGRVDEVDNHVLVTNWIKRRGVVEDPLSDTPTFPNTAKCLSCGKEKFVNTSGFCEKCWIAFSHLRKKTDP